MGAKKKNDELCHYGILGMKWGVRRYQNEDGSLTEAGRKKYRIKPENDVRDKLHDNFFEIDDETAHKIQANATSMFSKMRKEEKISGNFRFGAVLTAAALSMVGTHQLTKGNPAGELLTVLGGAATAAVLGVLATKAEDRQHRKNVEVHDKYTKWQMPKLDEEKTREYEHRVYESGK